jgi:uncharacterized protein
MSCRSALRVLALALGVALAGAGRAGAVAPEIKDDGKFFSAEAIKKANDRIRELARKYGRDLLIETYPAVPAGQAEKVKGMSRDERTRFFQAWAQERAEAAVVNGVYMLVCREPGHIQVEISPKARAVFDNQARDRLIQLLIADFREKHFDDGLLAAVKFVGDRLAESDSK